MSEGWEDWPLLGQGWRRRTAIRKSGASCGQQDTYYQSPTGQKFRSKIELGKFFGDSVDLSYFDFRNGVMVDKVIPSPKKKKPAQRKSLPADGTLDSLPKMARFSLPLPSLGGDQPNGHVEEMLVRCHGCKVWFAGVEFGKMKHNVWYCADCRASRRNSNKPKSFKNAGCGTCAACKVPENCGYCTVCLLRAHNPEYGSSWKCVKRRCLQVLRKSKDCGMCQACCRTDDCGGCSICVKKIQNPETEISEKCLHRQCVNKLPESTSNGPNTPNVKFNKLKQKGDKKLSQPLSSRRKNRRCGECESCLRTDDCGTCDFCQDKPKFGGPNLKRQKCRWRQCLRFAMERNIPSICRSNNNLVILERTDSETEQTDIQVNENMQIISPLREIIVQVEQLSSGDKLNGNHTGQFGFIKQEIEESSASHTEERKPLELCRSVKTEFITEDDVIEEADESTPVIMEVFSLGTYHSTGVLDRVLQEFMEELNEIPLPAHWEVLPPNDANLQLVQRSKQSTMADTVLYIQPGLYFNVKVKGQAVPPSHELYSNHPTRLTTVDEVVELICDLESYQPCEAVSGSGLKFPECLVLAYEERCEECNKMPWPSGSDQ